MWFNCRRKYVGNFVLISIFINIIYNHVVLFAMLPIWNNPQLFLPILKNTGSIT